MEFLVRDNGTNDYITTRDYHIINKDGTLVLAQYGEYHTIDDYIKNGWKRITEEEFDKAQKEFEDSICEDWKEITEEQYEYAMEVLPPAKWYDEGFFVPEPITGYVYSFYQRFGGKYYTCNMRITESRSKIIKSLVKFINGKGV